LAKLTEGRLFSTAKLAELSPGTLGAEAQRSKALPAAWLTGIQLSPAQKKTTKNTTKENNKQTTQHNATHV